MKPQHGNTKNESFNNCSSYHYGRKEDRMDLREDALWKLRKQDTRYSGLGSMFATASIAVSLLKKNPYVKCTVFFSAEE
jgi:hypothetical protein